MERHGQGAKTQGEGIVSRWVGRVCLAELLLVVGWFTSAHAIGPELSGETGAIIDG